jgi:geranylgeranyl pyrophosphate synthase
VVDDALRDASPSINVLYNSKIAVLVGDYLLAQGLLIMSKSKDSTCLACL